MPRISKRAQRDLEHLPGSLRERAEGIIARLDLEPALGKKLVGALAGIRSARLGRSHRILYRVTPDEVFVVTVSPRKDAYR
jgi:mRNA-degrading endonuclease RelE of RelBE toxin-antitoxin system